MPTLGLSAFSRGVVAVAAGLASLSPVLAQEGGSHPLDSALEMMNLKADTGPMPDFVTQSRTGQGEQTYLPVGAKPPARDLKPKSAADISALTAELDAARDAQLHGRRPKPVGTGRPSGVSAKGAGKTIPLAGSVAGNH